ncbi:MAG: helix-turn-helix domain-containing protein [Acidimicrobiales bacterium]
MPARAPAGHKPPLSIEQAAAFLNVEVRWMRRAVSERRLPYYKVGHNVRFRQQDLEEFLAGGRIEPRAQGLRPRQTVAPRR